MRSTLFSVMFGLCIIAYPGVFFAQPSDSSFSRMVTPYQEDSNTILLEHFDGSCSASILAYEHTGEPCGSELPSAEPNYRYVAGMDGMGQALELSPPAGKPAGSATYLKYEGQLLSQPNGTVECWVYYTTLSGSIIDQGPYFMSCGGWTFGMGPEGNGKLSASFWPPCTFTSGTATLPLNTWSHVAVSWGANGAKMYINKKLVGSNSYTSYPAPGWSGSVLLRLATHASTSNIIDELRISNIQRDFSDLIMPTGLTATSGAGGIKLSWDPNPESNLAGYNVYRSSTEIGGYVKINSSPVTDTGYTDSGLTLSNTYYYKITAVNTASLESDMTSYVSATVGSIVVWMPDYRGNAGDEVTLLINATNATGLSSNGIDVQVTYDTGLLTPLVQFNSGTTVEKTALTEGFLLFDNSEIAAGQINISGVSPGMTVTGEGHLFDIKFNVQSTVTPGEYCEHIFVVVKFKDVNGEDLTVDYTDTAVFTVAADYIRGDVNGDGDVDSGDAILALKIATGEIIATWLQMQAGDINGDGVIDSADAILILRLAVGLPVNPPEGGVGGKTAVATYTLEVDEESARAGDTVRVPISIDNASGFSGVDLRVNYDPSVVTALGAYTTTLSSGFNIQHNIGSSWIDVAMSTSANLSGGSGDLVELEFRINPGVSAGSSSLLNLSQKKLSKQYGENVAWASTIDFANGSITVLADPTPVPTATPPPTPQPTVQPTVPPSAAPPWIYDYNGDGTSDIGIFRPGSGLWAIRGVTRVYFGGSTDDTVPGDYDGDGTTDIGIFRPTSGLWALRGVSRVYFGGASDLPQQGDYDGDGTADVGIFRSASGLWAVRGVTRIYFGGSADEPAPGYYDGDSTKNIGIFRRSSGLWAIRNVTRVYFGGSSDEVVPGDYNGDGAWDIGIFRPTSGLWAIKGITRAYFGSSFDLPVPADYDGLGDDEIGIFRASSGLWAIKGVTRAYFGGSSDIPVTR